jgi:hypothetical protein
MEDQMDDRRYIAFNIKYYDNNDAMLISDMSDMIYLLIKNGYECLVRYEDCGIYILEYRDSDRTYGADRFMSVSAEEEEIIWDMRCNEGE